MVEESPAQEKLEFPPIVIDQNKKVAIVGTSHSWNLAPFDDTSVEIWGVNNGFIHLQERRKSRWFDIHTIEHRPDGKWYRRWSPEFRGQPVKDYVETLNKLGCPVYMQQAWPGLENTVRFPIEKIVGYFGRYITNSISMQIAFALTEGFGEIQVWGVDMSAGTEYAYQRPNAEYFLGMAVAFGAKVVIPAESDLLKTNYMYAYEEREKGAWIKKTEILEKQQKAKINRVATEINQLENELTFKKKMLEQCVGANQGISEVRKMWVNDFGHWYYPDDK